MYIIYIYCIMYLLVDHHRVSERDRGGRAHPHPNPPHADCGAWNETSFTMKTMNKVTWTHTVRLV